MIKNIVFFTLFVTAIIFNGCDSKPKNKYEDGKLHWVSINVSNGIQGDGHLITKNGKYILIDGGMYNEGVESLIPFLKENKILYLDEVYISHPHLDHYGGIKAILEDKEIRIGSLKMNMPTKEQMSREWWGGTYQDLIDIQDLAKEKGVAVSEIFEGYMFSFDNNSYMEVLYVYDGINTPVGKTDINDMSFISMIYDNKNKFLFTGDLNNYLGSYLAKNSNNIKADILKVPHHGTEGLAPNSFFDKVAAKDFIVPAPSFFWAPNWSRSQRVRDYIEENNINVYVNGIHGNIKVTSEKNGYKIIPQMYPKPFEIISFNNTFSTSQVGIINNTMFKNGTYNKKNLENITIYGSYNKSDGDKGRIIFQSKHDNGFIFKTGPVSTNQILRIYSDDKVYYEGSLPVKENWALLRLNKQNLPTKVFIEVTDNGGNWGEWSAIGLKRKE